MLKIDGDWVYDPVRLKDLISNFFFSLFDRTSQDSQEHILAPIVLSRVDSGEALRLTRKATPEEVRKAVSGMKRFGSPGPDGVPAAFYQKF